MRSAAWGVYAAPKDFEPGGGRCPKCEGNGADWEQPEAMLEYVLTVPGPLLLDTEEVGAWGAAARGRLHCTCRTCGWMWLMRTADDPENGAKR